MRHPEKVEAFEAVLRRRGIPYVAVDETKRALFGQANLKTFDFIVYSEGPNWLVELRNPTPEITDGLRQWEKVFDSGFVACFATFGPSPDCIQFADLYGSVFATWHGCECPSRERLNRKVEVKTVATERKESPVAQGIKEGLAAYERWQNNPPPEVEGQLGLFGQKIVAAPAKVRRETKGQKMLWE